MQSTSDPQRELWRREAPRLLSDADVARIFDVTPGYVPKLREKGWLPRRKKVGTGKAGGKGVSRYSFLDAVAAEVARISSAEFGIPPRDLRRMVSIIAKGDEDAVRASKVIAFKRDHVPGSVGVAFFAPEEVIEHKKLLADWRERKKTLDERSLIEIVEHVANNLYDKMAKAGFEFSGAAGPSKKTKARRKRN